LAGHQSQFHGLTRGQFRVNLPHPGARDCGASQKPTAQRRITMQGRMQRFIDWADAHRDYWLDCVRIYLGLGLFARGLLMITNTSPGYVVDFFEHAGQSWAWLGTGFMMHYVMVAHFVGGLLLMLGFLTRLAAIAQ